MKKLILGSVFMLIAGIASAQVLTPVVWSFNAKKVADKTYEIHLVATIQNGWHLYSQTQPADAINVPTEITFGKNPLLKLDGKTKESGKMEVFTDKKLGISANQYKDKVEFIQKIKVRSNVKTNVVGSVEFQTCDDKKCLPPKKLDFSVALR